MRLLAPKDAGALLGVCTERVQQLDREGKLRALRDSAGRRLFRLRDVERLRAEREGNLSRKAARKTAGG